MANHAVQTTSHTSASDDLTSATAWTRLTCVKSGTPGTVTLSVSGYLNSIGTVSISIVGVSASSASTLASRSVKYHSIIEGIPSSSTRRSVANNGSGGYMLPYPLVFDVRHSCDTDLEWYIGVTGLDTATSATLYVAASDDGVSSFSRTL